MTKSVAEGTMYRNQLRRPNGVLQVSKTGIDKIISAHFKKVFGQNKVADEKIWQDYWKVVDEVFDCIDKLTEHKYSTDDEPTESEIDLIVRSMDSNKSTWATNNRSSENVWKKDHCVYF